MTLHRSLAKAFLAAAATAFAAGCSSAFNGPEQALSVAEEHPISVDTQVVTLTLGADPTTTDLSAVDKARIRAFADAYLVNGHGPLTVTAPSGGGAADRDAEEAAADVRAVLYEAGVDWASMTGSSYRAGGGNDRQIVLSYTRYVATPSACGNWAGMRMRDYRNLRSPNFGCATQNNLAAMVADPRDLIQPADEAPADAEARVRVMRAYRKGEQTGSAQEANMDVQISQ